MQHFAVRCHSFYSYPKVSNDIGVIVFNGHISLSGSYHGSVPVNRSPEIGFFDLSKEYYISVHKNLLPY